MKSYLLNFVIIALMPTAALSHSGGTDSKGCHAGSQPYHCHNSKNNNSDASSIAIAAWDINVGYQYHVEKTELIPFIGASIGKSDEFEDTSFGVNIGIKLQSGWYASYVSTSKSLQLGYEFIHFSVNSDYFGVGVRFPFGGSSNNKSSIYSSGSILFSAAE